MDFSHLWEINWLDRGKNSFKKKTFDNFALYGTSKDSGTSSKAEMEKLSDHFNVFLRIYEGTSRREKKTTQDAANKNPLSRSHYTLQLYLTWLHYIGFIRDTVRNSMVCHRCYRTSAKDPDCAGLCVFVRVALLRSARQDRAAVCSLLLLGKVWQARTATLWTPFSTRML